MGMQYYYSEHQVCSPTNPLMQKDAMLFFLLFRVLLIFYATFARLI